MPFLPGFCFTDWQIPAGIARMNRFRDHLISRYFVKDYKMLSKTFEQMNQIFPKIFGYSFACANFGNCLYYE